MVSERQERPEIRHADSIASEVLSAALGGTISSAALYPLEVIKTRMQAAGDSNDDNGGVVEEADGTHEEEEEDTKVDAGDKNYKASRFRSNKKNSSKKKMNMVEFVSYLYRTEGYGIFFKGMEVSAFSSAMQKACYFCAYSALKQLYIAAVMVKQRKGLTNSSSSTQAALSISPLANIVLGCLAEWVHLPVTLPIDALATAIQTSSSPMSKDDSRNNKKTQDAMALLMTMWREDTVYKGIQAYYILCFRPALQYTIYEQIKGWILRQRRRRHYQSTRAATATQQPTSSSHEQLSASESFALGMLARTVATLFVFPFVRAKVRMQSNSSSSLSSSEFGGESRCCSNSSNNNTKDSTTSSSSASIWQLLQTTYTSGGIASLYQGLGPELTRGVLSAALMMMVKEQISGGVKKVLYG